MNTLLSVRGIGTCKFTIVKLAGMVYNHTQFSMYRI